MALRALEGTCKSPVGTRRWLLPPQCFRFAYLWGAGAVVSTRKAIGDIRGRWTHTRQSEAIRGNQRQSEALRGTQRHSEAIRGKQRQSDAIRCNQMQSEAIRDNQTQSEALSGREMD